MSRPVNRHRGEDIAILAERKRLYEAAKAAHPDRWSGNTRNWEPAPAVWLNPPNDTKLKESVHKKVA